MTELQFGFSPCPNDTFAFHALVHGITAADGLEIVPFMDDIEGLNTRALRGELALTKLSIGALAAASEHYVPLRAGAALGHGVGPLVVAREPVELGQLASGSIATPGRHTTAFLLLQLALGASLSDAEHMRYDQIVAAVSSGSVDAGLIIHESRFTYAEHGLVEVIDLGEWWETKMSLPVPLAVICARRDLPAQLRANFERALSASVEYAFAHPDASEAYVGEHAQELSREVQQQHINLYVNEFSIDIGDAGAAAVDALLAAGAER